LKKALAFLKPGSTRRQPRISKYYMGSKKQQKKRNYCLPTGFSTRSRSSHSTDWTCAWETR